MKFPDPPPPEARPTDWLAAIGLVALVVAPLIFVAALVKAFVISMLWQWYVVPHFHLEPLPMAIAFGVGLLVSYLGPRIHCEDKRTTKEKIVTAVSVPVLVLLIGWIGTFFI